MVNSLIVLILTSSFFRTRLENVILKIKILGYTVVDGFMKQLMDPPVREAIELATQTLLDIGAINTKGYINRGLNVLHK